MARQFLGLAVLLVLGVAVHNTFADEPERVVGGSDASPGEFPYQVGLRSTGGNLFCGGTLVTTGHVVTAAHCVNHADPKDFVVVTGSIDSEAGEEHRIRIIRVHPEYIPDQSMSLMNDIAVLTLADPVIENKYQRAIPVAAVEPPHGTPLDVSGWGLISTKGPGARFLQKASVFIQSDDKCRAAIPAQYPLYDTHVCAANVRGIGVCSGDSGGPLVYKNQLMGVVSWAFPCAHGLPDVYTKASRYYEFIKESILLSYEQ